jgi:hypothetical protein
LRFFHGAFNLFVMMLFIYQGSTGLRIRREKEKGVITPSLINKHRTTGPVLAAMGLLGFISGIVIVLLHFATVVKYPLHLAFGLALALCIAATYRISREIKVHDPKWRTLHFAFGMGTLNLYAAQVFLGFGILF